MSLVRRRKTPASRLTLNTVKEAADNSIPIEPLSEAMPGRDEARASFVADSIGEEEIPQFKPEGEPAKQAAPESANPFAGMSTEQFVAFAIGMTDVAAQTLGPKFVGGTKADWAQTEDEKALLAKTSLPYANEQMAKMNISPAHLCLSGIVIVYASKYLTAEQAKEETKKTVVNVPVEPPKPPEPTKPQETPNENISGRVKFS